jgi:hypothetical protein
MQKRGVFYLIDAFIAVVILVVALVLIFNIPTHEEDDLNSEVLLLDSFSSSILKSEIQDINNNYTNGLIQQGMLEPNMPVFIAIADLNRRELSGELGFGYAYNVSQIATEILTTSGQYGLYYQINDTIIYNKSINTMNSSKKRVTLHKMTFFIYNKTGSVQLYGPVSTEVSLWITS